MTCGIYLISCNGKPYIGQSINIEKRWYEHLRKLKSHKHNNPIIQRIYNKHGIQSLTFQILQVCSKNMLKELEQHWCNQYDSFNCGCNISPIRKSSMLGSYHSIESKQLISKSKSNTIPSNRRLVESDVLFVWERYMQGHSVLSIADEMGVDDNSVYCVVTRKYYREIELPASCRQQPFRRRRRTKNELKELFITAGLQSSESGTE